MAFDSNYFSIFLKQNYISFECNVELKKVTYFKSGGMINFFVTPNSVDALSKLIYFLNKNKIIFRILGATTNSIFVDNSNINICISLKLLRKIKYNTSNTEVYVESGVMIPKLVRKFKNISVTGFEGLEGIPATLGGAIFMNAGSYGYTISDHIKEVIVMDGHGELHSLSKKNCQFEHRKSIFHNKDKVIIATTFELHQGDKQDIQERISFYNQHRHKILEYEYPNVGSVFVVRDIYIELAKHSFLYKMILFFIRTFVHRIIRAKNNYLLNKITCKFFNIENHQDIVSKYTMNVVINKYFGTKKIIEYIKRIHTILGESIRLEIEII